MIEGLSLAAAASGARGGGRAAANKWRAAAGQQEHSAELLHTLATFAEDNPQPAARGGANSGKKRRLVVTALSWNSTGNTLAAAFGRWAFGYLVSMVVCPAGRLRITCVR
jgi:hypothetical protein